MKKEQQALVDIFDTTASRYHEYFPEDSREDVEFRLSRLLALTARRWGYHVETRLMAATGQSRTRWQTLFVLSMAEPPVTTSTLSLRLAIQWPPLIRTLNSLEADGLIIRTENPNDKRSRFIEITPAGMAVVRQVQPVLAEVRAEVMEDMDEEEMRIATRVMEKLMRGVTKAQMLDKP